VQSSIHQNPPPRVERRANMDGPIPATPAQISMFHNVRLSKSIELGSFAILGYDYLLTFSEELALVWKGNLTGIATILYFITRYLVFFDGVIFLIEQFDVAPSIERCQQYFKIIGWSFRVGVFFAQCILILRSYAICKWQKWPVIFLVVVHLGLTAVVWTYNARFSGHVNVAPSPFPSESKLPGCFAKGLNSDNWVEFLVILIDETVILVVTIFYLFRNAGFGKTPLLRTIRRDGILFYVYLQAFSIINIIVIKATPVELHLSFTPHHRIFHAILTCRVLLNMRRAAFPRRGKEGFTTVHGWESDARGCLPIQGNAWEAPPRLKNTTLQGGVTITQEEEVELDDFDPSSSSIKG